MRVVNLKHNKPESSNAVRVGRVTIFTLVALRLLLWRKMMEKKYLCECGCGGEVKPGNRFIHGHTWKGKCLPKETKQKMSEAQKGENNSFYSKTHSEETRKKIAEAIKGENNPFYGRRHTEETKAKIREVNTGRKHTKEARLKISIAQIKPKTGGYCDVWGDKEYIDDLRGPACEICGITNMMCMKVLGMQLSTHHKNGKKNCAPKDIQTLCGSCHAKLHTLDRIRAQWEDR